MAYVDIDYVKLVGSMPAADIDAVEALFPGTFEGVANAVSRVFDGKLAKRYAAPFVDPVPEAIRWHVAKVVTYELWVKRGFNPQGSVAEQERNESLAWLKEAADGKDGLIELPRREDEPGSSGVTKGGPLGYSEPSPYDWVDAQAEAIRGR